MALLGSHHGDLTRRHPRRAARDDDLPAHALELEHGGGDDDRDHDGASGGGSDRQATQQASTCLLSMGEAEAGR